MSLANAAIGKPFSATNVGTNAGVTATQGADADRRHHCTGVQVSGDAAALVTVKDGSTVKLSLRFSAAFAHSLSFETPIIGTANTAMTVVISASTSNSEANFQGYSAA